MIYLLMQKHSDRRKRQAGFTLMELLIVISIMLILMLIAIPNMLNLRSSANETSAIQSLRAIYQSQIQFQTNYPANGFACSLQVLGGDSNSGPPSAQNSQLLQRDPGHRLQGWISLQHRQLHQDDREQPGHVHQL